MAQVLTNDQNYHDIADAIRGKNGYVGTYWPNQMADAIDALQTEATGYTSTDVVVDFSEFNPCSNMTVVIEGNIL